MAMPHRRRRLRYGLLFIVTLGIVLGVHMEGYKIETDGLCCYLWIIK
jgi:hypothetical protein